jgi:hypothetical protein
MGSRQTTEREGARLPALSRRAVLVGTSASAIAAPAQGTGSASSVAAPAPVDAASPYKRYLYLDTKIHRLQRRWGRLESYLAGSHGWLRLTDAEQNALPAGQELRDIDGMLELLFEQREALLTKLPARGATTLEVVVARLAVVERLIWRDDHPEAHAMIAGARQDLIAFLGQRRPPTG